MSVVVGVGGRASAAPEALVTLVQQVLSGHRLTLAEVDVLATIDHRTGHAGLALLAVSADAGIRGFTAAELAGQAVAHPSAVVAAHSGTPSVAEAAVLAAGATPLGPPEKADDWVVAVGRVAAVRGPGQAGQEAGRDPGWFPPVPERLLHHGDVEVEPGMVDFAVNVHADEPPAFLSRALHAAIADLARYPDPARATAAVAAAHGIDPECVLLTHGAAEAFGLVAQQPWLRPAVVHPQFTEPEAALRAHGHDPRSLILTAQAGFRLAGLDPQDADLVVVGNPTNPTSRLHPRAEVAQLGDTATLLVDEAFLDVVEGIEAPVDSLVPLAAGDPRILVTRSLTKTYSIAGLRIGYLVGHPDVLRRLAVRRSPWPVSTLAAAAAEACVSPEGLAYAAQVRADLPSRLVALQEVLGSRGFAVVEDPRGPFVLARHPEAARIRERLRAARVAVRRADTFPGLDETWLRFAARGAAEVSALGAVLDRLGD
ncbi:Rv2231c family pyridoxal phosphate-dependent protein CobC [Nocardioides jiangxiensis]|uniref:Aminotransferase n=1 Tax=Nocardioides jiangxiensis TaxID=3064524 RepID=A0ABT9AZG1_9ACTN|nr:Rv2231c family pyridoxal phosphate-dependent protein CobC [Nocardioides sp. WY-20]MDO7867987.1 Rv2231c family pyridoxal phosphate-dependent protein CobC [Nocardioides sp. WY-20]